MRILHVVASLAPRYGGPSVACPALCRELARRRHEVAIFTTNVDGDRHLDVPLEMPLFDRGTEVQYFRGWTFPGEYKFSLPLWRALRRKIQAIDLAHIYSLYIFSATAAAQLCRHYRVPYLLHPHGSLDPYLLRRHAVRKLVYTALFERKNFLHAHAILFNSREEMRLAEEWLARELPGNSANGSPIRAVIPVGVEEEWLAPISPAAQEQFLNKFPELAGRRVVLFFGRLSFKKGMDLLAQAFINVAQKMPEAHLVLAGPDTEGYGEKMRQWLKAGGVLEKATFTGGLAGQERFVAMKAAEVVVLPSYSENFGQAVAEAMASGIPVVISDRVNLGPEVARAHAGIVVRCDPQEIAQAILRLLESPSLAREMGGHGQTLVLQKFTWKSVGEQMLQLYEEITRVSDKGHAPKLLSYVRPV